MLNLNKVARDVDTPYATHQYSSLHVRLETFNRRISSGGVEIRRDGTRRTKLAMKRKKEGKGRVAVIRWIFFKRG